MISIDNILYFKFDNVIASVLHMLHIIRQQIVSIVDNN